VRSTRIEKTRLTVPVIKSFDHTCVSYDRLNIVAESGLPLGCAHIGGKSTYTISYVSPTTACQTPPPSAAYSLYLRDRRISSHIAALCARYSFRLTSTATVLKSVPHGCRRDNPKYTSPAVLELAPRSCRRIPFCAQKHIAWDFRRFVNKIDAWLHFLLAKVRNLVRTFAEECISDMIARLYIQKTKHSRKPSSRDWSIHDCYSFAMEDGGRLAPMATKLVDGLAIF
jgi:hypothetical protein